MKMNKKLISKIGALYLCLLFAAVGFLLSTATAAAAENTTEFAGGDGSGLLFKKGKILRKVPEENLLEELMKEIEKL